SVLSCPIMAFTGTQDRYAGPEWIAGWRAMTTGPFRYRIFPGDHFFLLDQAAAVITEVARLATRYGAMEGPDANQAAVPSDTAARALLAAGWSRLARSSDVGRAVLVRQLARPGGFMTALLWRTRFGRVVAMD